MNPSIHRVRSALFVGLLLGLIMALTPGVAEAKKKYEGRLVPGAWEDSWTETLEASLNEADLLSHEESQIEQLCPGYGGDQEKRRLFWYQLLISLSWKESLHGPGNWIRFNGGTNEGLYQINPRLRTYYDCPGYDLFDATDNIKCGVKMARKLVDRFGTFLSGKKGGMAAYWQPLRATNNYNRKNREYILDHVRQACRSGEIAYHAYAGDMHPAFMPDPDMSVNTIEDLGLEEADLEPELTH